MEGYHSPQVEVAVRLNTNESPEPPPGGVAPRPGRGAGRRRLAPLPRPRRAPSCARPSPSCTGSSPTRCSWPTAPTRCCRRVLLTYGGPGRDRGRVGADLRPARPHRPPHRHRGGRGRAGRRPVHRPRTRCAASSPRPGPSVAFLCSPNNPTGMVDDEATVRRDAGAGRRGRRRCWWWTRPTASSRPWSALGLVDDDVPLVVTRTFSKTWSMAAARLGYLVGPAAVVAELDKVVLPYHLDAAKQLAGPLALDYVDEMERPGGPPGRGAGPPGRRPGRAARATSGRRAPTSSCSDPGTSTGGAVWQGLLDRSVLVRNFSPCPASRAACGSPSARPTRTMPSSPPSRRSSHDRAATAPRTATVARTTNETEIAIDAGPRRQRAGSRSRTGIPFFDHMLSQLGRHGGFDLDGARHRRPRDRRPPHRRGRRHRPGRGVRAPRSATRPASAASPPTGCRSTRPSIDVALDLSGRPYLVYEVDFPGEKILGDPPFDPQLVEEFWRAFVVAAGHHPARHARCGAATPTTSSRRRSRAVARSLRDAVRVEGARHPVAPRARCDRCIAVLDYGIGNLRSAQKALQHVGADARLTADPGLIARRRRGRAARASAPSAAAWRRCGPAAWTGWPSRPSRPTGPSSASASACRCCTRAPTRRPDVAGLGVLPGRVRRLPDGVKRPADAVERARAAAVPSALLDGLDEPVWVYFVHSYAAELSDRRGGHLRLRRPGDRGGRAGQRCGPRSSTPRSRAPLGLALLAQLRAAPSTGGAGRGVTR